VPGDDAYELAIEQYLFWKGQDLKHWEMLAAVGVRLPWPVSAETVVRHLARAEKERALAAGIARKLRVA